MGLATKLQWSIGVSVFVAALGSGDSPVAKVLQLLGDLETKIISEGEAAQNTFHEFAEWCEDRSKNLKFEIETGGREVNELNAAIVKASSSIDALGAEIESTAASIATAEADLKAATQIREKETKDFAAAEAELVDVTGAIERAIGVLEREQQKGGAAMVQLGQANNVVQALQTMVRASMLNSQDASKLTALVQSSQQAEDQDGSDALGAPDAAAYDSHSGNIIDVLQGLLDKAKDQLDEARKTETNARHNFEMLSQSLRDEIKFGNQDLQKAKKDRSGQSEAKATAEGDLQVTSTALAEDKKVKSTLKEDCSAKARDFEAETKSRAEELTALASAKKAVKDMAGGADTLAYGLGQTSLLELDRSDLRTQEDLANFEAVRYVRSLAEKMKDEALTQLARRMASAMRYGSSGGEDPFAKVKQLITDMIVKLENDASADATHKAYCDKELGETAEKKAQKEADIAKLDTSIDSDSARSATLKEEVATLQKELADMASAQAEATKIRQAEHAQFTASKQEMEKGLQGIKLALKILREYYAKDSSHDAAEGAGSGIIGLLEVVESDFTKLLAEMSVAETTSQADYDRDSKDNEVMKVTKEQDVKYKAKESKQLDASVVDDTAERSGVQTELSAILDYKAKLEEMCVAKPELYSERKARREAEIAGLKEALSILEGEAVLLQSRKRSGQRRDPRGGVLGPAA